MPDLKVLPLPFPAKGIHQASAISEQPEGTSPQAVNVRSFDLYSRRDRGCQRAGLRRLPNALNLGGPIDLMRTAMLGQTSATYGGISYTYSAATMIGAGNGDHTVGTPGINGYYYSSAYQKFAVASSHTAMRSDSANAVFTPGFGAIAAGTITFEATIDYQGGAVEFASTFSPGAGSFNVSVAIFETTVFVSVLSAYGFVENSYPITLTTGTHVFHTEIGLASCKCVVGGTTILDHTYTSDEQAGIDDIFNVGFSSAVSGTASIVLGASTATPGSDLYAAISISAAAASNLDPMTEQICYLQTDAGTNPCVTVGSVINGFTQIVGDVGTNHLYSTASQIDMVPAYGAFWLVDGVGPLRNIDPIGGAVNVPAPTAGTIPALSRILALYRGRLLHGGILADPFNIFGSRSGDPLDYDVGQLDSAGAFAGNATPQFGLLADYLTALIPFGDVSCLVGMGSSLGLMRGDPKAGGDLASISREVGIASLGAWCRSPNGDVYFMARDGLYKIDGEATTRFGLYGANASSTPQPVSRGRIDATLGRIDFTQVRVLMSWDPLELGVKIVLSPADATQDTTVVFWEQRKDAFWVDVIPATIAPRAVCALRGSGGPGGLMLYGGDDGWIRYVSPDAFSDDGTAINSLVRYAPITPFGQNVIARMTGLRQLWGNEAGVPFNAVFKVYTGTDPLTALSQPTADQGGTLTTGGYKSESNQRSRGNTLVLEISNAVLNKTWQIEETSMLVSPSGRERA